MNFRLRHDKAKEDEKSIFSTHKSIPSHPLPQGHTMNSPQGKAAFKQFQNAMSKVQSARGGTGGSTPNGAFAGIGGLLLLGGGALVVNST